jgi:hypothetical protein
MMGMVLVDPAGPVSLVAQGGLEVLVGPAGQVDLVAQDGLEVLVEVDRRRRLHRRKRQHFLWSLQSSQSWVGG